MHMIITHIRGLSYIPSPKKWVYRRNFAKPFASFLVPHFLGVARILNLSSNQNNYDLHQATEDMAASLLKDIAGYVAHKTLTPFAMTTAALSPAFREDYFLFMCWGPFIVFTCGFFNGPHICIQLSWSK